MVIKKKSGDHEGLGWKKNKSNQFKRRLRARMEERKEGQERGREKED